MTSLHSLVWLAISFQLLQVTFAATGNAAYGAPSLPPLDPRTGLLPPEVITYKSVGVSARIISPEPLSPGVADPLWYSLIGASGDLLVSHGYGAVAYRTVALLSFAAYEALVPYSNRTRSLFLPDKYSRPAKEYTPANIRVAVAVTIYRMMITLFGPFFLPAYDGILKEAGIDPNSTYALSNPIGLGNRIGLDLAAIFVNDGFNHAGNLPNVTYGRVPFSDYTGYRPVNTADELRDPTRWQPQKLLVALGVSYSQSFIAAFGYTARTYVLKSPSSSCKPPFPKKSKSFGSKGYRAQAEEVLAFSASLNDSTKMLAEFFDTGENIFGGRIFLANKYKWTLSDLIKFNFAVDLAGSEVNLAVLAWKRFYDAVRPFSCVRSSGLFTGNVTAWRGPFAGVGPIPAKEWRQYLRETSCEPEYPSGAASITCAFADSARRFIGTDEFGWNPTAKVGSSTIERGVTPKSPVTFNFPTFTSVEEQVVAARIYGGVHFRDAVNEARNLGNCVSALTWKKVKSLLS